MSELQISCANCGSESFEQGFIDDALKGQAAWFRGSREIGLFGNAKRSGPRGPVFAWRCTHCSRLELFAGEVS